MAPRSRHAGCETSSPGCAPCGQGCCAAAGRCSVRVYGSLRKGSRCSTAVRRHTRPHPSSDASGALCRTASSEWPTACKAVDRLSKYANMHILRQSLQVMPSRHGCSAHLSAARSATPSRLQRRTCRQRAHRARDRVQSPALPSGTRLCVAVFNNFRGIQVFRHTSQTLWPP